MNRVIPLVMFLLAAAGIAHAGGVDLSWIDCGTSGLQNRSFACNTSGPVHTLMASFSPPDQTPIQKLTGIRAVIDIQTADATHVNPWLELWAGGCRDGSLTMDLGFTGKTNCLDPWAGQASGGFTYEAAGWNRSRILVSIDVPLISAGAVDSGYEYYAFALSFDSARTIGTGTCAGCATAACIVLNEIRLVQPNASGGDYRMCSPLNRNFATWQGGAVTGGCPGSDVPPYCVDSETPRRTWGAIKSLYR